MDSQWSKQEAWFACAANEFEVQSLLHGQVSLAAVNQICVIHEAMMFAKKI